MIGTTPHRSTAALTLAGMLALAILIGGIGAWSARRTETVQIERDRTAHRALLSDMQREAVKLEALYESHLRRVCLNAELGFEDNTALTKLCEEVTGIERISFLYYRGVNREKHVEFGFMSDVSAPEPTLEKKQTGLPRPKVVLDEKTFFGDPSRNSEGWIDEPGKPLMFWAQRNSRVVVLTLHRAGVLEAMTKHFERWLKDAFAPLAKLGGADAVTTVDGKRLAAVGESLGPPQLIAPVVARYGAWQLLSWDHMEQRIYYHMPTLVGAVGLALLVALLGFVVFLQQQRAARLAAQRVSFVNRVSHELRSPLTNMLLNLDVAEEQLNGSAPVATQRLGLVREEAGRLSRLIDNVLTFSRREQGRLKLQPSACRPAEVVDGIVRQFGPAMERRQIKIERAHEGEKTECALDADALAQITANLLSNVEKYAPNGTARVRTTQSAKEFTLTVADEGPGIPAEERERVFEPFARLDDRVRAGVSGTGLGLSIARELAARMGGNVTLEASERGAVFALRVPVAEVVA